MSQPSQPPLGGAIKAQRRHKKQQEQALRARQLSEGLLPRTPPARPKACSAYATVAQEQAAREEAVTGQMAVLRRELPPLLERLEKIPDLRAARLPPPPRAAQGAVPPPAPPAAARRALRQGAGDALLVAPVQLAVMIVLKDQELPRVWEAVRARKPRQPENRLQRAWGERHTRFYWVNAIDSAFTQAGRKRLTVHVVVCEESGETVDDEGHIVTNTARHAGLSRRPLHCLNVPERGDLGARCRRGIEAGFLVEKHPGYPYEHAFALDWNAMKGSHYLRRMAHLFNTLARFARHLKALDAELGVHGAIAFIRQSCAPPGLEPERVRARRSQPLQLQLE